MYKLFIFDLDDTLIHEGFEDDDPILCDDTLQIFDLLESLGIKIAIATFNENGKNILRNAKLYDRILHIEDFEDFEDKFTHVSNIMKRHPEISNEEVCYVDDDQINVKCIRLMFGMKTIYADYCRGVKLEEIRDVLRTIEDCSGELKDSF